MSSPIKRLSILLLIVAMLLISLPAIADTTTLPEVAEDMTLPGYWADRADNPDATLVDAAQIEAMNDAFLAKEECNMTDLFQKFEPYDGGIFRRGRLKSAMSDLSEYMDDGYFRADGEPTRFSDVDAVLNSIDDAEGVPDQEVQYGICVALADVRAVPTDLLVTDEVGDNDYDALQNSYVRVNEPVVIRMQTADGNWYYCDTVCVSGWIPAEKIAVCKDRAEWLDAWQIPPEELLVVTEGKLFLDSSNANSASSERMLTMGTTLRLVKDEDFDPTVTNRALYHNIAVRLPVRDEEGRYTTTIALVPQHGGVNAGYLPLTTRNILDVAFSMLGDAYGWGGMLAVPDCSLYIRNIYKCFGLELPRNTTWQSAMPALKTNMKDMDVEAKSAMLDGLPAGAILFFRGHEMLYLGEVDGRHYVISSVGSIMAPGGDTVQRIRSVVINSLENTMRANGNSWLEDLNLAIIPYCPAEVEEDVSPLGKYWTEGSEPAEELIEYVAMVTDEGNENYIPKEERIAVFDMDGTLTCETFYTYYDTMMFIEFCLRDHSERVTDELKEVAASIKPGYTADETLARNFAKAYAGLTIDELRDYAMKFGHKNTSSFNNMEYKDGTYLPMAEVVEYLYNNGFTIWVISGTERTTTRAIVSNSPIKDYVDPEHMIGTDFEVKIKGYEDVSSNMDFKYAEGDALVFTGGFIQKNLNANKVIYIEREIGKRPVLAFGNSGSDISMMNYTIDQSNKYPAKAFMVVADDDVREWGTQDWDEKSEEYRGMGYTPISMKNDFATIYKEGVTRAEKQYDASEWETGQTAEESDEETLDEAA